jgi:DNA-directed RNA polymerase subunit beta
MKRRLFGLKRRAQEVPHLLEMQFDSYRDFLQRDLPASERRPVGLQGVFQEFFPVVSADENVILEFVNYRLAESKYSEPDARFMGKTYSIPLLATLRLIYKKEGEIKDIREQEVFLGDIPLMTHSGTFIFNGAERTVVSQLHRSPGVFLGFDTRKNLYSGRLIPDRGSWLEFEIDEKGYFGVKIDRHKRVPVTTFLRAIGFEKDEEIVKALFPIEKIEIGTKRDLEKIVGRRVARRVATADGKQVLLDVGDPVTLDLVEQLKDEKVTELWLADLSEFKNNDLVFRAIERNRKENILSREFSLRRIFAILRPGEPVIMENVLKDFPNLFFSEEKYDLGRVGRYKINARFEYQKKVTTTALLMEDILNTVRFMIKLYNQDIEPDDIDHFSNRRVRSVGELLTNQFKIAFSRMVRIVRERMAIQEIETLGPREIVSVKPVSSVLNEFFGTSQLSQFLDQTNPLAEITHKRRLTSLGPGGLSRDRAGYEVRDVHYTHYGRVCPIETPEGPNIGLIVSLSTFARINEYGFIVSPYRKVINGKVSNETPHLTALDEEKYVIAQANAKLDDDGAFSDTLVSCRHGNNYFMSSRNDINFMDVSPKQIISISAGLIPFLEHDDANRALMGSNMQRQAVPLLRTEPALVGTGLEEDTARYSGSVVVAEDNGEILYSDATRIKVKYDDLGTKEYLLEKYRRTNQGTCFNQRPIVITGEKVKKGLVIADGPATSDGELALGKNLLVAFLPWEGYNYEDAILISERIVSEDRFTSVHVEEFEIEARETKLGPEKITRDIPNLSEDVLANLDENGIIRVGAKVVTNDILVGKVTPKGQTELTPEYKLLHSIFGEKVREVRDTSLRLPHGNDGVVIDVKVYRREDGHELLPGVDHLVKVYIAQKRKLQEGDKLSGRHGNKGVLARILPVEDMPFLEDGTPVEIVLNPLGVPSRMNIGQILETQLGWAMKALGMQAITPVFEGATVEEIEKCSIEAGQPSAGKSRLVDGRSGLPFKNPVTVGIMYVLKLNHLVEDKIHARSTGPYSLVTQQPLGGKAQFGGQRLGEMEVWAFEAYGAAHSLQELLTAKSDDMLGRARIYEAIVHNKNTTAPGIPESFNVLIQELRGLCLDMKILDSKGKDIDLFDDESLAMWEDKTKKNINVDNFFKV